ncbi:response regulator transcription factor [Sphingobacterium paludis]|uniref:DNA-binding response OmpR family regulator n=1 Tax=Sphingobacterium paludis TaxID=1476465 RepID=A0A4R7CWZ6_9SPHI|nr:response regulator transcription factor [Sphingobacterium paludis]TDS13043.1 DNA-binding response OmpR family regulator [Sphingobacterium paludis]
MEKKRRLLYVEDEADLGNVVSQYLEMVGFEVVWVKSASDAHDAFCSLPTFDLMLIDVQLPDYNGFQLAEEISERSDSQAFLFLTARREKKDRLQGLNIGADDYITKPFDVDELVLRIRNILKRLDFQHIKAATEPTDPVVTQIGDMQINQNTHKMHFPDGKQIDLTLREMQVMLFLYRNQGKLLRREDILVQIWGENDYFMGRSLDVFISRIRKFLKHSQRLSIETVYGSGFIFRISEP